VANTGDGTVSVIETRFPKVLKVLNDLSSSIGRTPTGVAIDSTTHRAFVTNAGDDTVTVIDIPTLSTVRLVGAAAAIGDQPVAVAVDEKNRRVYVANSGDDTVTVFDADDYTRVGVLADGAGIGVRPSDVAIGHDTGTALVANTTDGTVTAVAADAVTRPEITTRTLPDATQGSPYSAPIRTSGIGGPEFELAAPKGESLPDGLTIDHRTGVLQGTITAAPGSYRVTILVSESGARVAAKTFTLRVLGPDM
jgi:DNA-binding beta-propeller fold protein YncE